MEQFDELFKTRRYLVDESCSATDHLLVQEGDKWVSLCYDLFHLRVFCFSLRLPDVMVVEAEGFDVCTLRA